MKSGLHILLVFLGINISYPQITVSSSSIAPSGLSWVYHADVGNTPVQIPSGGPNQVWSEPAHSFGYNFATSFENPAGTPFDTAFISATHCVNTSGNYAYLQLANNEFRQLGAGSGINVLHYNPTSLIMPVPLTYPHDPWTRVFQYSLQIIPGFKSTVRDSSIITLDGWGTLTTQYGTFQVLRTLERHWITESLNGIVTANKKSTSYVWFDDRGVTILSYTNNSDSINFKTASIVEAEFIATSTELESNQIASEFSLSQNYPNPFNPSTKISWQSPVSSHQTLKIYDVLSNEVATLVDEYREAGVYEVEFDASQLSSGIYFYQLQAGGFVETKKMILLR
jgi:hypothetical protein